MQKFSVKFTLTDGREVVSKLYANNDGEAIKKVMQNPEYTQFVGSSPVQNVEVEELPGESNEFAPTEFYCNNRQGDSSQYIVEDRRTGCVVEFTAGDFNHTAKLKTPPTYPEGATEQAKAAIMSEAMRRIGDYMASYRRNLATGIYNDYRLNLALQFKTMREAKGLNVEDVAEIMQLPSCKTIERIEKGYMYECKFGQVERFAEAIGCTLQLVPDDGTQLDPYQHGKPTRKLNNSK